MPKDKKKPEYKKIGDAELRVKETQLKEYFDIARAQYVKEHRRMNVLDLTDGGGLWEALGAKFPAYQILPDTNHVSYIKNNLVASIYTVAKSAELLPTSDNDIDIIKNINIALEQEFSLSNIGKQQKAAGNNAALHNIGITQVGWDDNVITNHGSIQKGHVKTRDIHPLKFMRDPFSTDLQNSAYVITYDRYHKTAILANKKYRDRFKEYLDGEGKNSDGIVMDIPQLKDAKRGADKDYYALVTFWVKVEDENGDIVIDEIHTINAEHVLYVKNGILPNIYPFAILYCNSPGDRLVGISEPARAFANSVAYNIMDSISLTSAYKNQRPPKFVSTESGLNVQSFAKHANDADYTFVVQGDARQAVHYHEFPKIDPNVQNITDRLDRAVDKVSGVDGRYTGRETGSIITTGGIENQLNRVTVIDTPKIDNLEDYTKQLTELVLFNLLEFGDGERTYVVKKIDKPNSFDTVTVKFEDVNVDALLSYQINISSELPRNKARIAEMGNQLMEKQLQYTKAGEQVDLITPEEWLATQDLPMKEYMLERMGIQRLNDALEDTSQVLFEFAELTKQGMNSQDALMQVAQNLDKTRKGQQVVPEMDPLAPQGMTPPGMGMPEFGQDMPPGPEF